jgi:hypothetical protein
VVEVAISNRTSMVVVTTRVVMVAAAITTAMATLRGKKVTRVDITSSINTEITEVDTVEATISSIHRDKRSASTTTLLQLHLTNKDTLANKSLLNLLLKLVSLVPSAPNLRLPFNSSANFLILSGSQTITSSLKRLSSSSDSKCSLALHRQPRLAIFSDRILRLQAPLKPAPQCFPSLAKSILLSHKSALSLADQYN